METQTLTAYQQIAERIATSNEKAVQYYFDVFLGEMSEAYSLKELGFTAIQNLKDTPINETDALRAKLKAFFKVPVLTDAELQNLEKMFKLQTHVASRFVDTIPDKNVKEILEFHDRCRKESLNYGKMATDKYFVPLTTDYMVTAPAELFRKAISKKEMTRKEYLAWMAEDPIVSKPIFRFEGKGQMMFTGDQQNRKTGYNVIVTAWGLEALLINPDTSHAN